MLAAASLLLHASDTRAQERLQLMNVSAPGSDSDGRAGATGRSRRTHGSRMPYPGRRRPGRCDGPEPADPRKPDAVPGQAEAFGGKTRAAGVAAAQDGLGTAGSRTAEVNLLAGCRPATRRLAETVTA